MKMTMRTVKLALTLWALAALSAWPTQARAEKVAYLGVQVTKVDATLRDQVKLERGLGLTISTVMANSPAETAGLKPHDILEKLNDQLLFNGEQFASLVRSLKSGDKVTLTIIRQGQPQKIDATLGETDWTETKDENLLDDNGLRWNKLSKEPGFKYGFRYVPQPFKGPLEELKVEKFTDIFQPLTGGVFLGVEVQTIDAGLAAQLGLEEDVGVLVGHVMDNSPAEKAGLKEHDVIAKIDGQNVNGNEGFLETIRGHKKGDKIVLGIIRGGKPLDIEVTLSQRGTPEVKRFRAPSKARVAANASSVMRIQSDEGDITITDENGKRHATVKGPEDDTLFEGPINTDEERAKVPPSILQRIQKTEKDVKEGANPEKGIKDLQVWPGTAKPVIIRYQANPEPGVVPRFDSSTLEAAEVI